MVGWPDHILESLKQIEIKLGTYLDLNESSAVDKKL